MYVGRVSSNLSLRRLSWIYLPGRGCGETIFVRERHMPIPRSRSGRWSLIFSAVAACLFAAFFVLVLSGQKGGETFFSNPFLAGALTAGATSSVAAGIAGLYGIVREHERSLAVFVATTFGFLVLAYAIAEGALPH